MANAWPGEQQSEEAEASAQEPPETSGAPSGASFGGECPATNEQLAMLCHSVRRDFPKTVFKSSTNKRTNWFGMENANYRPFDLSRAESFAE